MKILIFNQKGGVGKTTTALNLGAGLARDSNKTVTLVDLDPQTHLTAAMGLRAETLPWNVSDWLAGNRQFESEVISDQLQLIGGDCNPSMQRALNTPLMTATDYVVIDAPPMWTPEVAALMKLCDWVLTPMEPEFLSMQGISRLMQRMEMENIPWSRLRLLLCRYDDRLIVHREVRARLAERFGQHLLPDVIRNNVRLAESPSYGQSIFDYAPNSAGAEDYAALVKAILALEKNAEELGQ
jgi:chromosome partitioning protein